MFLMKNFRAWLLSAACNHHRTCCRGLLMVAVYHIVGENGCQDATVWRTSPRAGNEILVYLMFLLWMRWHATVTSSPFHSYCKLLYCLYWTFYLIILLDLSLLLMQQPRPQLSKQKLMLDQRGLGMHLL